MFYWTSQKSLRTMWTPFKSAAINVLAVPIGQLVVLVAWKASLCWLYVLSAWPESVWNACVMNTPVSRSSSFKKVWLMKLLVVLLSSIAMIFSYQGFALVLTMIKECLWLLHWRRSISAVITSNRLGFFPTFEAWSTYWNSVPSFCNYSTLCAQGFLCSLALAGTKSQVR